MVSLKSEVQVPITICDISWFHVMHDFHPYYFFFENSLTRQVYCKHGYFRWGKFSQKCWLDISCRGKFHGTTLISFIKAYGFYFPVAVIFEKKIKERKMQKISQAKISTFTVCETRMPPEATKSKYGKNLYYSK